MAALSSAKRLARIGWWLGLSLAAMLAAACGAMFASACKSSPGSSDGGSPDATGGVEHIGIVIPPIDAGAPTDASETDLWNTICE
jgi:hypothetical protein